MTQFVPHPPEAIEGIPKWVFQVIPDNIASRLRKTGILEPEDVQMINLKSILPFSVSLTIGFPLFLLFFFWSIGLLTEVTIGIAVATSIIFGFITIPPLLQRKSTNVELKWYGLLTIGNQPINILLPSGSYVFWLPEKFLGVPLVHIKLIPEREIPRDLNNKGGKDLDEKGSKDSDTKEGGIYSSDGVELFIDLTYVLRVGCVSSAAGYVLEQPKWNATTARAAMEEIKNLLDDFLLQVVFKSAEQNTYKEMVITSEKSGELNSMFWKQLCTSREVWHIFKYEGKKALRFEDKNGRIVTIQPGKVIVTQGGTVTVDRRTDPKKKKVTVSKRRPVLLSDEDYAFWQQALDENGEQVFFPEYGTLILKAWIKKVKAIDPKVHEAFISQLVQEMIGKGAVETARANGQATIETAKAKQAAYDHFIEALQKKGIDGKDAHDQALVLLGSKTISEEIKSFGLSKETMESLLTMAETLSTMFKKP